MKFAALHMQTKSSSVKAVNLVKKCVTVTEIMNFSKRIVFYWRTLYIVNMKYLRYYYCKLSAALPN